MQISDFRSTERGFTMIEILIVMTLIVVLAGLGLVQYRTSVQRAEEAVLKENLFRLRDAIDQYYADKTKYPGSLSDLVSEGYIREVPKDPMTQSADSWQSTPAEPDANNPASTGGIYDVKSGSDRTAIDGTRYSEWE